MLKLSLRLTLLCLVFGSFSLSVFAQQSPPVSTPNDAAQDTIKLKTDLVQVDALVTDKKTRQLIRNLTLPDFELFEDGKKQELESLSQDKLPLSLVLLLDVSPSVMPVMEQVRNGALQALQRLKPEDEVALMTFSGFSEVIQDFTQDRQLILWKLEAALKRKGSGTRIHEALGKAAQQFKQATLRNSRRVILIITDNQGSMSRQYDDVSEAIVRDALIESNATVCGLIARSWVNLLNSVWMQHPQIEQAVKKTSVNSYVELTGGDMTAASKETVNDRLAEMIERLRNCYTLGYTPTNQDFNGKYRRIQVALSAAARQRLGTDIQINAKQGYYALDRSDESVVAQAEPVAANTRPRVVENAPANVATAAPTAPPMPIATDEAAKERWQAAFRAAFRQPPNPYAHLTMLDVRALNKKTGKSINDLSAADFELEDNSVKKPLVHFSYGEAPLAIALVIDRAGNTSYALSALRRTARFWMSKLQPEDQIALLASGAQTAVVQGLTNDAKVIQAKLRDFDQDAAKLNLGPFQDRVSSVFQAAEYLDKTAAPLSRRVVIVITDDTQSFLKGTTDVAAQMLSSSGCVVYGFVAEGRNPSKKGSVKRAVIESAIYSFGNPVSFAINLGTRLGTQVALDALLKDRSFNQVVTRSGGMLARADGDAASDEVAALLDHLHQSYLIGFQPDPYAFGDRYHKLKLTLKPATAKRLGDTVLLSAQGYYTRKAADLAPPQVTSNTPVP